MAPFLAALPASAQDATWLNAPGSGNFNTGANWDTATVPTGTAFFDTSGTTALTFSANTTLGGWTFNPGASAYNFTNASQTLQFTGAGIVVNGGSATIANDYIVEFYNGSTAGSATIGGFGAVTFQNTSTAGSATITNNNVLQFNAGSTAGSAAITNNSFAYFFESSTAGSAGITNNNGSLNFNNTSTAGSASITNNSILQFIDNSTAGGASITNNSSLVFYNTSTAGNAAITNGGSNTTDFSYSTGPLGDNKLSAGSLAGGGNFRLGQNELTVGGNNLSTTVTGVIADGGANGGTGGALIKTGTGTMTLSGINTYTGGTTVNGGTLAVNSTLTATSGITVNSGGALGGTGTVGATTVNAGGTLAPGNSIGTLSVQGNLTFNSGGIYAVEVSPAAADRTNVTGTATLTGATVQAVALAGSFRQQTYTIMNATGGFGGTQFAGITGSSFAPGARNPHLTYDTNNVFLVLDPGTIQIPAGIGGNQAGVAGAINNFVVNGGAPPAGFDTLLNLTGAPLDTALGQVSGQPGASTAQTGSSATGQFVNAVFGNAFGGGGTGGAGALGFAEAEENAYAPKRKVSREAKDAYAAVTPRDRKTPTFEGRGGVFASVYGGNNRVGADATAGTNTTTSRTYGAVAGADYRFTPDTQAGFALGGAGSNFSIDGGFGSGKAEIFNAAVYGRHDFGAAYVAGALSYSWQDTTTDRPVTISGTDRLHASFKAQALAARLESGWRYATPFVGITPYAALQSTSFFLPAYGETATSGSNQFALSYASKTTTNVRTELGAKFDKAILVRDGVLTLTNRTAWAHDSNIDSSATATFQSLPGATFTTNGAQPSPNAALVSLGAEMKWHNGWSIAANVDGEFSRTTASYTGKGTVRYAW